MPPLRIPLTHSKFTLNTAGVAGFFGGEEVLATMGIMHLYKSRQWIGWYNSPGSYAIAKRFGRMANSPFWDGLFPGPNEAPAEVFGFDVKKGPQYIAALSGTTMTTGHLAYLTTERLKELKVEEIKGRVTTTFDVAYLPMKHVDYDTPVEPLQNGPRARVPVVVSLVTCVMCALVYDWFIFSMILIGIISNGFASLVIGRGELVMKSVKCPALGAPPGHGVLMGDNEIVVVKGEERDVNAITKGRFDIEMGKWRWWGRDDGKGKDSVRHYNAVGICSLMLLVQFFAQLLLVPQGTLFGQIMFLCSLGVSWGYNTYLSSLGVRKEKIQSIILFQKLGNPEMRRFRAGTRTTMSVFVCLLLFHKVKSASPEKARELRLKTLCECIPNNTDVWGRWREKVVNQLLTIDEKHDSLLYLVEDEEDWELPKQDRALLEILLRDARAAFEEYLRIRDELPADSSQLGVKEL